ncbi:MAG: ABC transporter ATP-binding protein, partial [Thermoplasmataceae archaeon]
SAQAMREELLDLWMSPDIPPHTVLLVTHNVDEAVQLSDRIVILSRRPSRVIGIANIDLPRPRNTRSDEFYKTVDEVVSTMSP